MKKHAIFLALLISTFALSAEEETSEKKESPWAHSSELGIALSGGNSNAQSYQVKEETSYTWGKKKNKLKNTGHYFLGQNAGVESAKNWHIDLRYERSFSDRLGAYLGHGYDGDTFAGFAWRASADLGGKYFIFPEEKKNNYLVSEVGYKFMYQEGVPTASPRVVNSHFVRLYLDGKKVLSKGIIGRVWVEFLPDLVDSANLNINFEPSLSVVLSDVFSLKLAFTGKYDGVPATPGAQTFDFLYTTSLVATL